MSASLFNSELPPVPVAGVPRPNAAELVVPLRPVVPLVACVQHFASTPSAAGWARRHTTDVLERWGCRELTWPACQVVSELVTNAITHTDASSSGQTVSCRLTLKLFSDVLAIEVWDPADGHTVQSPCPDLLAESGRGLAIVGQLCAAPLMVFDAPACGKTVVALLARP